jgi:hypothetical protein
MPNGSDSAAAVSNAPSGFPEDAPDAGEGSTAAGANVRVNFQASWCAGPGQNTLLEVQLMKRIAEGYEAARAADCHTAGLLPVLNDRQRTAWLEYLIGYSVVMSGCPETMAPPVEGGILVFGPGNTAAIGLTHPPFGRDDAGALIQHYLDSFSSLLMLDESERTRVETQLWSTAELVIDGAASGALSTCSKDGGI